MPSQAFVTVVVAGATVQNLMAGSQFEFPGRPPRVQVYQVRDPAGAAGIPESTIFFGQELELASSQLSDGPGNAQAPRVPDNQVIDDIAAGGDRLVLRLQETGGAAATTVRTLVVLTPVA